MLSYGTSGRQAEDRRGPDAGAFHRGVRLCFECAEFPCETTRIGPIGYGYCTYISGKEP